MPMPTRNGKNPQLYEQWTVEVSQNGLCTKSLQRHSLDSRFVDLENIGEHATLKSETRVAYTRCQHDSSLK